MAYTEIWNDLVGTPNMFSNRFSSQQPPPHPP